jgi:ATPase complex subunit ATP10
MGIQNKFVGYVYLVDWLGRIRWAGCGGPWSGVGGSKSLAHGTSAVTENTAETSLPQPEGGRSGQVSEGLVQGLGEVHRLNLCLSVLMNRLEQTTQADER